MRGEISGCAETSGRTHESGALTPIGRAPRRRRSRPQRRRPLAVPPASAPPAPPPARPHPTAHRHRHPAGGSLYDAAIGEIAEADRPLVGADLSARAGTWRLAASDDHAATRPPAWRPRACPRSGLWSGQAEAITSWPSAYLPRRAAWCVGPDADPHPGRCLGRSGPCGESLRSSGANAYGLFNRSQKPSRQGRPGRVSVGQRHSVQGGG